MSHEVTVWVVQDNDYNIRPAEKYGTLRFITQNDLKMTQGSRSEILVGRDIREFIDEYKPEIDHILLVGNPVVIGLVFHALGTVFPNCKHNILKWDSRERQYYDYVLDTSLL